MKRGAFGALLQTGGAGNDPHQDALAEVARMLQEDDARHEAAIKQTAASEIFAAQLRATPPRHQPCPGTVTQVSGPPPSYRAQVLAYEVSRAEELAERRLRAAASITPGSRSKSTARGTYLPPKAYWQDTFMRSSCASLLTRCAADAVLVAHHLHDLDAHPVTTLARLNVHNLEQRSSPEAGSTRKKKRWGEAEKRKNLRVKVWHWKQKRPVARARVFRTGK
jgi:hypothetical protein